MDSPKKSKKGKAVMEEASEEEESVPYKLLDVRHMETNYIDRESLRQVETGIFKGTFLDEEKKNVSVILPPASSFKLHMRRHC